MSMHAYCGNWATFGGENGLWMHDYDLKTGALSNPVQINNEISSSYAWVNEEKRLIYFVDERDTQFFAGTHIQGGAGGFIWVYKVNEDGQLELVQKTPAFGSDPAMFTIAPSGRYGVCAIHGSAPVVCQVAQDEAGEWQIVPGHADASLVLFAMNEDGTIGKVMDICKPSGSKIPHLHTCEWAPSGNFFLTVDKGGGDIYSFSIDEQAGKLVQLGEPYALGDTTRPRYVRFNPVQNACYVNYEAANKISAFSYNEQGELTFLGDELIVLQEEYDALPVGRGYRFEAQNMRVSADGKHLYTCVHCSPFKMVKPIHKEAGFDAVVVFELAEDGRATRAQFCDVGDAYWPRGCTISPDGRFLLVTALFGDCIATLRIGEDGLLEDTGLREPQSTAASMTFFDA